MGTALSHFHTSAALVEALSFGAAQADIEVNLVPTPFADAPLTLVPGDEVFPAERSELACRAANVVIASIVLMAMLPVLALIALAVRLTSRGPVFYSQIRVGVDRRFHRKSTYDQRSDDLGGRPFRMFKFRTMRTDAEADGKAVWAQKRDPRTTVVGKFLRKYRLDEIPQLWNVIRGDMNIVGPRPERPTIFAELREEIPLYAQRQRVRPGITGWAQINQSYDSCLSDVKNKVRLDLEYVGRQSLAHDMMIMSLTLPVMLFRKGGW